MRVSFARRGRAGSWRAHGRYLQREGAQHEGHKGLGLDAERDGRDLADTLGDWQKRGDPRIWKLIVSPEAAHRLDLREHARELMASMEAELGRRLEWVAIDHHNTAQPHVHVVVRGVTDRGAELRLDREDLRRIRQLSRELATRRLGLRTAHEAYLGRERALHASRYTELDASLERRAAGGRVDLAGPIPTHPAAQERRLQELRRLRHLETLGLARRTGNRTWGLSPSLRPTLAQLQLAGDIVKSRGRRHQIERGADPMAEARTRQRERTPMDRQELERVGGKPVRMAVDEPGRLYRGHVVGYLRSDDGRLRVVLDTGRALTAIPTRTTDLEIGAEVRVRARPVDHERDRRRVMAWGGDEVDGERSKERGRDR